MNSKTTNNTNNNNEEESTILAAIGTSVTASSTYEDKVLNDATLSSSSRHLAPSLTGIGFPNLEALAPSFVGNATAGNTTAGNTTAGNTAGNKRQRLNHDNSSNSNSSNSNSSSNNNPDAAHMVTIFNKVQNQLYEIESTKSSTQNKTFLRKASQKSEHKSTNKLRMKKQILLSYFESFTNLQSDDIGYDNKYDSKMEQLRNYRLLSSSKMNTNTNTNTNRSNSQIPMSMMKKRKKDNENKNNNNTHRGITENDIQRLEDIKQNNILDDNDHDHDHEHEYDTLDDHEYDNNENDVEILLSKSKNASFGKHAIQSQIISRKSSIRSRAKRKMMYMKKQIMMDESDRRSRNGSNSGKGDDNGNGNGNVQWIDPEVLYQKRLSRIQRRKERREKKEQLRFNGNSMSIGRGMGMGTSMRIVSGGITRNEILTDVDADMVSSNNIDNDVDIDNDNDNDNDDTKPKKRKSKRKIKKKTSKTRTSRKTKTSSRNQTKKSNTIKTTSSTNNRTSSRASNISNSTNNSKSDCNSNSTENSNTNNLGINLIVSYSNDNDHIESISNKNGTIITTTKPTNNDNDIRNNHNKMNNNSNGNDDDDNDDNDNGDEIKTVSCAICKNDSIKVPDEHYHDIDSFLSQHMTFCLNKSSTGDEISNGNGIGKPVLRSSSRLRTRSSMKQVNYKEEDENEYRYEYEKQEQKNEDKNDDKNNDKNGNNNREKIEKKEKKHDNNDKRDNDIQNKQDDTNVLNGDIHDLPTNLKDSNHVNESDIGNDDEESSTNDNDDYDEDDDDDDDDDESTVVAEEEEESTISSSAASAEENEYKREKKLDDFHEEDYEDRVDEWIVSGIQNMRKMKEQDSDEQKPGAVTFPGGLEIPAWVNDRLFGYQRTALRWMWELHLQGAGGIVGDEMGLGKTVQLCSYLGSLAASRKMRSVLIIAPATILVHWLSELETWAPGLRRILVHKSGEKGDNISSRSISRHMLRKLDKWLDRSRAERMYEPIDEKDLCENDPNSFVGTGIAVLTTFEGIRRSTDDWVSHNWSYVVMDEGQKIRNPDAEVTIACKRLRTTNRLLLSGTPIQNDLKELWSLFDFVFPGRLGVLPTFLAEFADPIRRGGYSNASPMQVQLAYRCALVLRDLINPYLLRRQKKDVKEVSRMPGKVEQVLFCKLSIRQRRMYEAYLESDEVQHILRNRGTTQSFRPIITLRKICNHPHLLVGSDPAAYDSFLKKGQIGDVDDYSSDEDSVINDIGNEDSIVEGSGKLEVLAKILPLWKKQGHRFLIFSQWKKTLDIIQHFLNSMGWNFGRMDGNTNVAGRQKLVDRFNNDESIFGMLLTTKTGGVGLNLIGANRVVLFDPDWNPQSDAQARERAWRFGQKNPVTVYRLITAGTIEEKIYQRQIFKTAIANQVLQDPRQKRMFSQKDLRDLFTLKSDIRATGGNGVTETGELTKGKGVINADDIGNESPSCEADDLQDNKDTLDEVLKAKGLAGIFDHDIIDQPFAKKSQTAQEMEEQAKKVAARAAKILAESSHQTSAFEPTWTGASETAPRFGGVASNRSINRASVISPKKTSYDEGFGGARSVGVNRSTNSGLSSSSSLLTQVRKRRQEVATGGQSKILNTDEDKHVALMKRIRAFIVQYTEKVGEGPTTEDIIIEFEDQKNNAVIFRSMLKSLALCSNKRWILK